MFEIIKRIGVRCEASLNLLIGLGFGYMYGVNNPSAIGEIIAPIVAILAGLINIYGLWSKLAKKEVR